MGSVEFLIFVYLSEPVCLFVWGRVSYPSPALPLRTGTAGKRFSCQNYLESNKWHLVPVWITMSESLLAPCLNSTLTFVLKHYSYDLKQSNSFVCASFCRNVSMCLKMWRWWQWIFAELWEVYETFMFCHFQTGVISKPCIFSLNFKRLNSWNITWFRPCCDIVWSSNSTWVQTAAHACRSPVLGGRGQGGGPVASCRQLGSAAGARAWVLFYYTLCFHLK